MPTKIACRSKKETEIAFLIILVGILLGFLVRTSPFSDFSSIRSGWEVGFTYPVFQALKSGHVPTGIENTLVTRFDAAKYASLDNPFSAYLVTIILLVTGNTSIEGIALYLRYGLFMGLFVYPMFFVLIAHRLSKKSGREYDRLDLSMIYLLATLGSWVLLQGTAEGLNLVQFGLIHLIILFYILTEIRRGFSFQILFIVCAFAIIGYYHTAGIALVFLLLPLILFFSGNRKSIGFPHFQFYLIIFSAYFIFLYGSTFEYFVRTASNLGLHAIELIQSQQYLLAENPSNWWTALFIINALTLTVPILFFLRKYVASDEKSRMNHDKVAFFWLLGMISFVILLGIWGGLGQLVSRGYEYLTMISIPIMLIAIAQIKKFKRRRILALISTISVISASLCFLTSGIGGATFPYRFMIRPDEWQAGMWASANVKNPKVIFTDFRLIAPIFLFGNASVDGIVGDEGNLTQTILEKVYYHPEGAKDLASLADLPHKPDFFFFSRAMSEMGVRAMLPTFKPPPTNFLDAYDLSLHFDRVYDNSNGVIYRYDP